MQQHRTLDYDAQDRPIEFKHTLLAALQRAKPKVIPVTPENIFAAADLVKEDQGEIFRDGTAAHPRRQPETRRDDSAVRRKRPQLGGV